MKNTFKFFGIITLLLVIGFSMAACDNGSTEAEGTFTITDIPPSYNGKYVMFVAKDQSGFRILGIQEMGNDMVLTKINNGKAVIPLLNQNTWDTYKGNDTFITNWSTGGNQGVWVSIYETATIRSLDDPRLNGGPFASVKFSNGRATKSWKDIIVE
jgi:hypothetical protein